MNFLINTILSQIYVNFVTFQEAESRMLRDGERALKSSQEGTRDEVSSTLKALNALNNSSNHNTTATYPENRAETSASQGLLLPKVGSLSPLLLDFSYEKSECEFMSPQNPKD